MANAPAGKPFEAYSTYEQGPILFEQRRSLDDDRFLGDRIPERLGNGPVNKRRITDKFCLAGCCSFLLFFIAIIITYSFRNNYALLQKPLDSDARICGEDPEVKNYPFLYIFKFEKNYRSVCVKECLKFDYNQIKYNSKGTNTSQIKPLYYEGYSKAVPRSYLYSSGGAGAGSSAKTSKFDYDADFAADYFSQANFDDYRSRLVLDCVTNTDVTNCKFNPKDGIHYYDSRPYALNICFPLSPNIMKNMGFFGDISAGFFSDISAAWWMIFLAMLVALLIGVALLYLSSYAINWLIWIQFGVFILLALFVGVLCWIIAFGDYSSYLQTKNWKPEYVKQYSQLNNSKWEMILAGLALFILGISVALFLAFNISSVSQASIILKHGVLILLKNFEVVLLCILAFAFQLITISLALWGLVGIYTSGAQVKDSVAGEPIADFNRGFWRWALIGILIIATYWIVNFINNFADFITSGSVINHYFARKPSFMTAIKETTVYHLGSVALSSLVLFPVTILQLVFGWVYDLMTATGLEGEANTAQIIAGKVCCCILYPYKKFILRVNENAFGMVYLSSADFCPSSKEVYYLFLTYAQKIGRLDMVSLLYKTAVAISIALLNSFIFYLCFTYFNIFIKSINNPFLPTFLIFLATLIITTIMMNAFTTATNSTVLCYLIEVDVGRNPRDTALESRISESLKMVPPQHKNNTYNPLA
jgi:Plasma-membrane choline transporter